MASTNQGRSLKKFCSLLTYIEHRNRELYDTIHDLCLTGIFNTRRGRSVTFLMPDSKSSFHSKIVNAAYGANPDKAVNLIRACVLLVRITSLDEFAKADGGKLPNELKQDLEVDKPGDSEVVLKNGSATIIADGSFRPLYETSRFGVFIIKSGEVGTDNSGTVVRLPPKSKAKTMETFDGAFEISGGMERVMQAHVQSKMMHRKTLVKTMLDSWKASVTARKDVPEWLIAEGTNVFVKAAVSLYSFLQAKRPREFIVMRELLDPNPMCICVILSNFVEDDIYNEWVADTPGEIKYTYAAYEALIATQEQRTTFNVDECLDTSIQLIKKGDMKKYLNLFSDAYAEMYKANGAKMLSYHEGLFIALDLLRASHTGNTTLVKKLCEVFYRHYCLGQSSILTSQVALDSRLLDSSIACKSFAFMQTLYFAPRNNSTKSKSTVLANWQEPPVTLAATRIDPTDIVKKIYA